MKNKPNPRCPECGSPTVGYSAKTGTNWRCIRGPYCRGFIIGNKQEKTQQYKKQHPKKDR